ncbi:Membrane protein implicated in regulation of membrane protease activity [Noviherbaspirillum humi]|uniref:Membrane protein implicated in regulation of membrane protease activity n=1 Tax=Noviherbaspirillum humi TaxID=1688639 RepID=A0A239H8I2_9BURK|nr:NfeD family protein [Noviherbaspirillum humi]SNS77348.1 Membrane protein implicated in regulation of membrane protease activity [Noviherbaspirillum humi]
MDAWMVWIIMAGTLILFELFTGTFYLLMIGLAAAAGGIAAFAGLSPNIQFGIAAVVGVMATYALRRSRFGHQRRMEASRNRDVNLDIGQPLTVHQWQVEGGLHTARAMYRGAMWDVELRHGVAPRDGSFTICEVKGNRLVVE